MDCQYEVWGGGGGVGKMNDDVISVLSPLAAGQVYHPSQNYVTVGDGEKTYIEH
jgi:hypothetical protein